MRYSRTKISLLILACFILSVVPVSHAQSDPCTLESVLASFEVAVLSEDTDDWLERYAASDCPTNVKQGTIVLSRAHRILVEKEPSENLLLRRFIENTFDVDGQEWKTIDNADAEPIHRVGDDNNGYICAEEGRGGAWWYFRAPADFHGDFSMAYGGVLHFDLKQEPGSDQFDDVADVVLKDHEVTLLFYASYNPQAMWTAYTIPLLEYAGWIDQDTGLPPTQDEMVQVLSNIVDLNIRGEYRAGYDMACLDNVTIGTG